MRRLSSRWTILPKYIIPSLIAALLVLSAWFAAVWWESLLYVVLFGIGGAYAIAFAADLCQAETDGQTLFLRGLRQSDRVALTEIKEVAAFTNSKWPHIDIVLRRSTTLGDAVRIMPRADFWATYELLATHAETRRHDTEGDAQRRAVRGARAPLVITITIALVAILVAVAIAVR